MYFELDGSFPNHEANPQKYENLQDLIKVVIDQGYDFGIAFDGDGDRAVFIDNLGRPVLGTDLLTALAKLYLQKYPGSKIVHDVRTSRATQELIEQWGGEPVRTKAGRVNIGSLMREVGAPFGGETTGHMFFKENYDADSGLITALVAMQALSDSGKKLSDLIDEYRLYVMIPEMNIETSSNKEVVFKRLSEAFADAKQDWLDGLTVNYPDYWFNLRASNTEPVMRLNAEAKTQSQLDELVQKVTTLIHLN
jgi:phosphomannomutase